MHPIAFEIGGFAIRWYGIMAACGFICATLLINWNRQHARMNADQASALVMMSMIFGVIGARVFYVIQFFDQFRDNLWQMVRVDRGGLVFYGGFFLAALAVVVFCRLQKLDVWRVFDVIAPALAIGHACGRIGCFLNGCCYGKPTACVLGVVHGPGTEPARRYGSQALHPVQLYEAAINIGICLLLLWLLRKNSRRGVVAGAYLALYGAMRFADEFFRGDHNNLWNGLTPAQSIGLLLMPLGLVVLYYFGKHERKNDKA